MYRFEEVAAYLSYDMAPVFLVAVIASSAQNQRGLVIRLVSVVIIPDYVK